MIHILARKKVLSLLSEIHTTGHSPLKIVAEDNEVYFTKNYEGKLPAYYLTSEIICHYFLTIWQIPTPNITLLELNAKVLKEYLDTFSKRHKAFYYDIPAVGSLLVIGQIMELNSIAEPMENINIDKIENKEDVWKIALFDIWVENDDRKPSNPNMLRQQVDYNTIKLYALDHAFCFNSLKYKDLNPNYGITQSFNDNILYTELAKYLLKNHKDDEKFKNTVTSFFQEKITLCKQYFETIWNFIPIEFGLDEQDRIKLFDFLFHNQRNQEVIKHFFEHIHDY